ncbi:MAG TPA: glycosyltransferase 87 family protein, partial [Ktedonobacterales bacterium]
YPLSTRFLAVERQWLAAPARDAGEFDPATLHSYPALSFLLYVPLVWAGVGDVLILNVLVCAALLAWLAWLAPVGRRGWAALTLATAAIIPRHSLLLDSEVVCVALLLAAWHWRERRWVGAILLGLACAFKQYCWFFAPFLLLEALLTHGWREAARRGGIAAGAFLLPNLPFLLASPRAWLASLALPMRDPMFPSGIGLIALAQGHLLPYGPPLLYAALEGLALVGMLWLFARYHARLGEAALLLALLPLWFAFRSPPNYFAFAPWLAVYAICVMRYGRRTTEDTKDTKGIVVTRRAALAAGPRKRP